MSGTAALNVASITFGGTLKVEINTTPRTVNDTFTVGTTPITINLPAGKFLRVTGTGLSLVAFGQTLKGDFSFTQSTVDPDGIPNNGDETKVIEIKIANGELGLGDGTTDFVRVTNAGGSLFITPAGIYGQLSATVAVDIPQVTMSGSFTLQINKTNKTQTVNINGQQVTLAQASWSRVRTSA